MRRAILLFLAASIGGAQTISTKVLTPGAPIPISLSPQLTTTLLLPAVPSGIARIAVIGERTITLDGGRVVAKDFVHLDQGVCITSYASQCRTVRQIVALVPIQSFAQMDSKAFYVLASRATHRAVFYTDCKDALKDAVIRPGDRETVWDYEKDLHPQPRLPKALIDLQPGKRVKHIAIANDEAVRAYERQQRAQEMEVQR